MRRRSPCPASFSTLAIVPNRSFGLGKPGISGLVLHF
jgi:hypothetical protein